MQHDLETLAAKFLGPRFAGRRYLRYGEIESLGIVTNRGTLDLWIERGAFPRGIRIAGPYGKTLVWLVPEIVEVLAERAAAREDRPDHPAEENSDGFG
jgi:hypothetical protein